MLVPTKRVRILLLLLTSAFAGMLVWDNSYRNEKEKPFLQAIERASLIKRFDSTDDIIARITKEQSWGRQLSRYDNAGHYDFSHQVYSEEKGKQYQRMEKEIREFLWNHWNERRLGYIRETRYGVEGQVGTSHMFVEPDGNGEWRIYCIVLTIDWRIDQTERIYDMSAYKVERIKEWAPIPPEIPEDPLYYKLILKDKQDRLLREFYLTDD